MYTRRDVCTLTGLPEAQFKNLARRDQLPFERPRSLNSEEYLDRAEARGWNRFSAIEVLRIAVQHRLMTIIGDVDGLGPETARDIVGDNGSAIQAVLIAPAASDDQWIGRVAQPTSHGDCDGGFPVSGSLGVVAAKIGQRCFDSKDPESKIFLSTDAAAERVFLLNVSEVLRAVKLRASAAGIQFSISED